MRIVSDFREAMWGVLQQGVSTLDVDFVAYAGEHFDRLLANAATPAFRARAARGRGGLSRRRAAMDQARVVVIGGGITGCSVAYHLAAGRLDGRPARREGPADRRLDLPGGRPRHRLQPVVDDDALPPLQHRAVQPLGVFERVGSLRLASSRDQLLELRADRQPGPGDRARRRSVISAEEARRLMPAISPDDALRRGLAARRRPPRPAHGDPCRRRGRPGARRPDPDRGAGDRVRARPAPEVPAAPDRRRPDRDRARRQRGRHLGAAGRCDGRRLHPVDAGRSPAHRSACRRRLRAATRHAAASATRTTSSTARASTAGCSSAATRRTRTVRWMDGVPWEHAAPSLPPDFERFGPLMGGAIRRFPFLADAEVDPPRLPPRRDDPGREPAAGPAARCRAGSGSPPASRSTASAAPAGSAGRWPAGSRRANRASTSSPTERGGSAVRTATRPSWRLARETYSDYYRLRYPFDADVAGRPRRLSALHGRLQEAGRGLRDQGRLGAGRLPRARARLAAGRTRPGGLGLESRPWFERVVAEGRAVRERAGMIDLSSFGKIASTGPGALGLLQRVAANDVDRPVGAVVYSQFLDERGGMVADVTMTRLADDRFRVVTGAGSWPATWAGSDCTRCARTSAGRRSAT